MLRRLTGSVRSGFRYVWGLVHGYDDIRGSRLDSSIPEGPTAEEIAAARRTAVNSEDRED